jgi:hypothetical protein
MSDDIRESKHERKVRFHSEAPFAKHDYRYRSRDVIRMAGKVWSEGPSERRQRLERERLSGKSKSTPVGLGFAERDAYGPNDNFGTARFLSNIRAPEDYRIQ